MLLHTSRHLLLLLITLFLLSAQIHARQITAVEYFIDEDPGFGNAVTVPVTPDHEIEAEFIVDISELSDGFHFLAVRAKQEGGKWSMINSRMFLKESADEFITDEIASLEYFVDTDPGFGNGTPVPITAGTEIATGFTTDISGLSDGFHSIAIRAKQADGKWSLINSRMFLKESVDEFMTDEITKLEYFVDTDPGFGNGTSVPITAGTEIATGFTTDISGLSDGFHSIAIRAKQADGKWSLINTRMFLKESLKDFEAQEITTIEYFVGDDPGFGNGTSLSITKGENIESEFTVDISGLSEGFHTMVVRAKQENGQWSLISSRRFLKEVTSGSEYIQEIEYEIYNSELDLIISNNVKVEETGVEIEQDFAADIQELTLGEAYSITSRVIDTRGVASMDFTRFFSKQEEDPERPNLINPENNAADVDTLLNLTWNKAVRADSFRIEVATTDDFSSLIFSEESADTTTTVSGLDFITQYFWRVQAFNPVGESTWSDTLSFTTRNQQNQPPQIISRLGSLYLDEDFESRIIAVLDTVFTNPEEHPLTYQLTGFDDLVTAELRSDTLLIHSVADTSGSGGIFVQATDNEGLKTQDTLSVFINPVNDLPVIHHLPDTLVLNNDETLEVAFDTAFTDEEDNLGDLTFELSVSPEDILLAVNSDEYLAELTAPNFSGEGILTFLVTDSDGGELEATVVILVNLTTSKETGRGIPTEFVMKQNYPNPFNPTTKINYQLPEAADVRLQVFDMLGRNVATLVNERKSAGIYTATFDASSLSSGMYIYRIEAGNYTQTRKLTLIK